jgi:AAA family ATP:ADP antiporter
VAKRLASFGPLSMLLGAALILVVCALLVLMVHRRERAARDRSMTEVPADRPPLDGPELGVLLHDKYLLWIALATFLLNCVNSSGEYLLDRTLLQVLATDGVTGQAATLAVTRFKADYFWWVNVIGVLLQLFAVSRLLKLLTVRRALFVLPAVAFLSYGVMFAAPVLALIRLGKIAENSLDYSLQNTARQALFLVGTRAEKYLGKTTIDTLVVRLGDVFAAILIFFSARMGLHFRAFALVILALISCWSVALVMLGREHKKRSRTADADDETATVVHDEPEAARSVT